MQALKRLVNIPAQQMVGLAVAFVTIAGFLIGLWTWLQTPDYRVLFSGLTDRDGGAVIAALSQMQVPYKYNEGGSAILVPSNQIYDTRQKLAAQGLPKSGVAGFELLDQQKFGTTQMQEQVNFQRGLEGELVKSIQTVAAVQSARVHLAIPKPTIFLREHQKPTASVVLSLFPGKTLDGSQVQGITHLVAASVPELADRDVSVVDGSGNLLSRPADAGGLDPNKLAYLHELEQNYAHRVTAIIETIVGPGNVHAEVTADLDFSQTEQTAETFKPNAPESVAMRSQQTTESSNSNGSAPAGGVPGAQANTPTNAGAPATPAGGTAGGGNTTSATKKDATVNYELDRVVETKRLPVGTIRRLSAAIVVNNRLVTVKADVKPDAKKDAKADPKADAKPTTTSEPLKKEEIDQITALARETLGFDEKRGDSLNVVNASFQQPETLPVVEVPMWKDPENIATAKDVGKNVGFALVAAYLIFGVLRPALRRVTPPAALPAPEPVEIEVPQVELVATPALAYPEQLARARQLARDDPKAVAGLVRNWVAAQ